MGLKYIIEIIIVVNTRRPPYRPMTSSDTEITTRLAYVQRGTGMATQLERNPQGSIRKRNLIKLPQLLHELKYGLDAMENHKKNDKNS